MSLSQMLLPEFDQEMAATRKSLERVPDDKFGWKPHEKSATMGWLASHLVMIPYWAQVTFDSDSKKDREALEEKRIAAAQERMRRLGHV